MCAERLALSEIEYTSYTSTDTCVAKCEAMCVYTGQCGSCTVQCGDDGPEPWEEKSVRGNSPSHQPHHYSHHTALPSPHCHAMLSHCNFGKGSAVTLVEWASNRITERCFCCTGVGCGSSSWNKDKSSSENPIP